MLVRLASAEGSDELPLPGVRRFRLVLDGFLDLHNQIVGFVLEIVVLTSADSAVPRPLPQPGVEVSGCSVVVCRTLTERCFVFLGPPKMNEVLFPFIRQR